MIEDNFYNAARQLLSEILSGAGINCSGVALPYARMAFL